LFMNRNDDDMRFKEKIIIVCWIYLKIIKF